MKSTKYVSDVGGAFLEANGIQIVVPNGYGDCGFGDDFRVAIYETKQEAEEWETKHFADHAKLTREESRAAQLKEPKFWTSICSDGTADIECLLIPKGRYGIYYHSGEREDKYDFDVWHGFGEISLVYWDDTSY